MPQAEGSLDAPVPFKRVLVANRSDVAVRVSSTCRALGITTVGVAPADDGAALHLRHCDEVLTLAGSGPEAYLDIDALVGAAVGADADALHPGWGFRAESPELAQACYENNIVFIGPSVQSLRLLGDKAQARVLARTCGSPIIPGTDSATTLAGLGAFWDEQTEVARAEARAGGRGELAVVLKARSGGGGRGIRVVSSKGDLDAAFRAAGAEALAAFGSGSLYVERMVTGARHVEVQLVGDAQGRVRHLWDRECSIQRQHQKLVEIAPSPVLPEHARSRMLQAATRIGAAAGLVGLATVEFLATPEGDFWFLECNPRLQVEHTVTEAVLGMDLVQLQLQVAAGVTLTELGIETGRGPVPRGTAVQVRISAGRPQADGGVLPETGIVSQLDLPTGAGVRVDAAVRRGSTIGTRYDPLLAKVVAHGPNLTAAVRLAGLALADTCISGVATNLEVQRAVLEHPDLVAGRCDTGWFERTSEELVARAQRLVGQPTDRPTRELSVQRSHDGPRADNPGGSAGAADLPAHLAGTVVSVVVTVGDVVDVGDELLVLDSMKMQHPVLAQRAGRIGGIHVMVGQTVQQGQPLLALEPSGVVEPAPAGGDASSPAEQPPGSGRRPAPGVAPTGPAASSPVRETPPDASERLRPDLASVRAAHAALADSARPDALAARHERRRRTARENVAALTDGGLVVEYGGLAVAAQRRTRSMDDLVARTPADGIVTGLGHVNAGFFGPERSTVAVAAYDFTVLAGTQGLHSHAKLDRLLAVAHRQRHPVILFAEGGGGRPNDTDVPVVAGLHVTSFAAMGRLSGLVPLIGIAAGYCFAGNAALLGTCDVVIATEDSSIGMGGPAMIDGAGLGVVAPDEVGPVAVHRRTGVVDVVVADEAEAAAVARQYLGFFQGPATHWEAPDARALRHVVPEDRRRVYDVRSAIAGIVDLDSVLELRRDFGPAAVTALARIEGRPVGVIANQPMAGAGAIDAPAADKLARFLHLCDAYGLPVLSLCDTPGFMVGPQSEGLAAVRHFPRLFVLGGNLTVPLVTVVLRKAYGLGAMAMAAGGFHQTAATLAWPTGEFGAMGLEGAVRLGARDRLAAAPDERERSRVFDELVAQAYERGGAINTARHLEVDDVIDPADTRAAVVATLLAAPGPRRDGWVNADRRSGIDTW